MLAAVLLPAGSALALSYPVTSTSDEDVKGTLRASIKEANAHPGADSIPIEVTGTIQLETALQVLFGPVSIIGPGADQLEVRRTGSSDFAVFGLTNEASPSSLSGLTVSNGRGPFGAGIRNSEGSLTLTGVVVRDNEATDESGAEGGGIYSEGPLTLRETVVTENVARASGNPSLTKALGGGIAASGPVTIEASTISGNVAEAEADGSAVTAQGGGLLAGTEVTISRSTVSGNAVDASGAASQLRAQGGGIQISEGTLTGSTLAANSATSDGLALGANIHSLVSTTVRGTLLAQPLGGASNCSGGLAPGSEEFTSGGYNLDEDDSCELGDSSDLIGVVAGLDPVLRDNGGPTPTLALLEGSIAIDRGNSFGSGVDQRNLPRPSDFPETSNREGGDGSDIGAFELQVPPGPEPVRISETAADTTPPNTRIVSGPPRNTYKRLAKFRFAATEAQSTFQCKVDKKKWRGCANPYKRSVKPGKHVFKVRATDRFGNVDPTPARFGWRVKRLS
ncbi:MAG: hypothetical protein QOF06_1504 [Solirubrobacterales bacterium]|jgi:hypothetical protein|nr:hypothetical protein [Solirubrobacterales bacterium]